MHAALALGACLFLLILPVNFRTSAAGTSMTTILFTMATVMR
jgi:hypothetical protein